jgi:hypothetical protein
MPFMLVRHKVKDCASWKPFFDRDYAVLKSRGSTGGHLFRNADNPNEIIVLFDWEDLERARQFAQSEKSQKVMQQAGVIDTPDFFFLEEIEEFRV